MDLVSKDVYIQKLASQVFSQRQLQEPRKRPFGFFKGKTDGVPTKKKKKLKKKHLKEKGSVEQKPNLKPQRKTTSPVTLKVPAKAKPDDIKAKALSKNPAQINKVNMDLKFSAVDVLRRRLHEKIEESRGQGPPKDALSAEVQAKRAKRKLERERKKRKRKEIRLKKLAEKNGEANVEIKQEVEIAPVVNKRDEASIVFNKVETVEGYKDKMLKKKNKKKSLKGQTTPLTGKNYKQLLSRVQARKAKLEQLREKDEDKAREMENKEKWTNLLYKAEGVKIKDDENMLRVALKRKEKRGARIKKNWDQRSENVVEKMQRRQDKRKKNIQKRRQVKTEKKKDKARKKGRVLPEDLKKAAI